VKPSVLQLRMYPVLQVGTFSTMEGLDGSAKAGYPTYFDCTESTGDATRVGIPKTPAQPT